jgi:hypothetical protein
VATPEAPFSGVGKLRELSGPNNEQPTTTAASISSTASMSQPFCSCDLSPWRPSLYNVQDPTHKLERILRQIGQQHRLKDLIRLDVSDLWLPVPKKIV